MYFHRELITFGMTEWVKGSLVGLRSHVAGSSRLGLNCSLQPLLRRQCGCPPLRAAQMVLLPSAGDRGLEAPA